MLRKKSSATYKTQKASGFGRFLRSMTSIIILSALVLAITMAIKELYTLDTIKVSMISRKLLARAGLNVDNSAVGEVAGKFVERMSQTDLGSGMSSSREQVLTDNTTVSESSEAKLKVAVFSDIHGDLESLEKALSICKGKDVGALIILGDLTDFGDIENLQLVKNEITKGGFDYFIIPGDHDLAQSLDTSNFEDVFGDSFGKTTLGGFNFLLVNNSANFTQIPGGQMTWFDQNISTADFVILSQPLYADKLNAPFSEMFMGSTQNEIDSEDLLNKQAEVKSQRDLLLEKIRSQKVKAVIAGDHHKSSVTDDVVRPDLKHYVVGAISDTLNEYPQKIVQSSRFSLLTLYDDGTFKVEDVLLD